MQIFDRIWRLVCTGIIIFVLKRMLSNECRNRYPGRATVTDLRQPAAPRGRADSQQLKQHTHTRNQQAIDRDQNDK